MKFGFTERIQRNISQKKQG